MIDKNFIIQACDLPYFLIEKDLLNDFSGVMINHCIRAHMQNARQGTVACKSRSELVSRSNKKPWKQKGTGRARAGTARSPLWRGGGVAHGPQKRTRVLKVTNKVSNLVKVFLLKNLILKNKVNYIDWVPNGKCSDASKILGSLGLLNSKIIVLYDIYDHNTYYSFVNLENVWLVSYDSVYPYVMAHDYTILFLEKDNMNFKSLVKSWLI